jgi:MFS transporter, DHA2 family, multidrug resistance protein
VAGLLFIARGGLLAFTFPMSGWLADTVPPRVLLVSGFVLVAGAGSNTTFWALVGYTLIQGFGLGLIHPTLNATGLRAVSPETVSAGAGTLNLFRQLGARAPSWRPSSRPMVATRGSAKHSWNRRRRQIE